MQFFSVESSDAKGNLELAPVTTADQFASCVRELAKDGQSQRRRALVVVHKTPSDVQRLTGIVKRLGARLNDPSRVNALALIRHPKVVSALVAQRDAERAQEMRLDFAETLLCSDGIAYDQARAHLLDVATGVCDLKSLCRLEPTTAR